MNENIFMRGLIIVVMVLFFTMGIIVATTYLILIPFYDRKTQLEKSDIKLNSDQNSKLLPAYLKKYPNTKCRIWDTYRYIVFS